MFIELTCKECGDSAPISFASLYEIWKEGYETLSAADKKKATAYTEISCYCGHVQRYDGPMFSYVFQLIFEEFVKEEGAF